MKRPLVIELQLQAQTGTTPLPDLLRLAKVVATRLKLPPYEEWIARELNGYEGLPKSALPAYRTLPCWLAMVNPYHGLQPVTWSGSGGLAAHFASLPFHHSVGKAVALLEGGNDHLYVDVTPQEHQMLLKAHGDFGLMPSRRVIDPSSLRNLLEAVRNRVLDWALDLEKSGIFLAEMTINATEYEKVPPMTNHYHGPVVQGNNANLAMANQSPGSNVTSASGGSQVTQGITGVTAGDLSSLLAHFRAARIAEPDLVELQTAIAAEPKAPSDGSLVGAKVGAWVGGMVQKVLTRSWEYAHDAAFNFLVASIQTYYRGCV